MLWPFNYFRRPDRSPAPTIEVIYGMIVTRVREPVFYRDLGVPDTVDGRFDLLLLHLWMVLRRLRTAEDGMEPAQALFDRFCEDMDDNLREMGVGDLAVPRRMQAFGEAFYGRSRAYDLALGQEADQETDHASERAREALAQAIAKNILDGGDLDRAQALAAYTMATATSLAACDDAAMLLGAWSFPPTFERR
ncbi:MAG TPA: ubiquinol-cytochrome C chaperone family protein [Bradyrhizobium sp.]|nr:ubiquinol-cytochrome C chaperone family protein [Bradyrhizobium sp.]